MSTTNNTSSAGSAASSAINTATQAVSGAGEWKSGTTVREIEGHFNPEHNPKTAPISGSGGVPKVDYDPSKTNETTK